MTRAQDRPARTFAHRRILQVTRGGYTAGPRLLADAARQRFGPITAVIGVATGGTAPAVSLGELLATPVYRVEARHNPTDAPYTPATGHVTCEAGPLAAALGGRLLEGRVLLVDDICGTGATLHALRRALTPYLAPGAAVNTAVLCRNTGAARDPDLWLWTVDDWVRFPWEPAPPPGATTEDLPVPTGVLPR